ncbi:hypothetical protein AVEN_70916-1 [Araneus ventricosus]|uniref:Uncharacterized protein n=1 Tax=Araneus ventricosus TaxID=182803 RepID=A0A4Y2NMZ7_ARAVE|nr:hypothetical protein AVEN_70916-1 [Araneus ventricosus]
MHRWGGIEVLFPPRPKSKKRERLSCGRFHFVRAILLMAFRTSNLLAGNWMGEDSVPSPTPQSPSIHIPNKKWKQILAGFVFPDIDIGIAFLRDKLSVS